MKHILATALVILAAQSAFAKVTVLSIKDADITLKITGSTAKQLTNILARNGKEVLIRNENDFSNIQSLKCSEKECILEVNGDYYTSSDANSTELGGMFLSNKSLSLAKKMNSDQLMISVPNMGRDTGPYNTDNDASILKSLMISAETEKNIKVKKSTERQTITNDTANISVLDVEFKSSDIQISCNSTIITAYSNNKLSETCSFEVVAEKNGLSID